MTPLDAITDAIAAGFDMDLIESNLALTPEQRMEAHQGALDLVWEFERIRDTVNEESQ